eukprot:GHVS01068790.1.p1 GENE.GHVS01068790.1~~GHVS01068790.1.p1  ORF type:complete len:145 (-),score=7.35 GHVS01068790.1:263-697(-)
MTRILTCLSPTDITKGSINFPFSLPTPSTRIYVHVHVIPNLAASPSPHRLQLRAPVSSSALHDLLLTTTASQAARLTRHIPAGASSDDLAASAAQATPDSSSEVSAHFYACAYSTWTFPTAEATAKLARATGLADVDGLIACSK